MLFGVPVEVVAAVAFLVGVGLVLWSVETFIEAVAEGALALGISGFFLTVVLAGTDLENLVLALVAVIDDIPDLALGIVFGEALFVLGAAVGLAGLVSPFETHVPRNYLLIMFGSPALFFVLALDGTLTRLDGAVLTLTFVPLLGAVFFLERNTSTRYLSAEEVEVFEADEEKEETDGADDDNDRGGAASWRERNEGVYHLLVAVLASVGMVVGSEIAVWGARRLLVVLGITGLAFGATVMSFVASLEELFLTIEPVRQGRAHLGVGNVVGSVFFFVTANAGMIALVRPIDTSGTVLTVHWPFFLVTLAIVTVIFYRGTVGPRGGVVLLGFYVAYWVANLVDPAMTLV